MLVSIELTDDEMLLLRHRRYHPARENIEESVKKVTKEVDISVNFCDNGFDLRSATIEDVLIGRIKGEVR